MTADHPGGMAIEAFGLADNLMLIEAIRASGERFHAAGDGDSSPANLAVFETCAAFAARASADG